jgi:hypothetical protein
MTPEIKDFTTWPEAARWLAKHGWGLGLIEQQKELWEAEKTPATTKAAVKPAAPAKTTESAGTK